MCEIDVSIHVPCAFSLVLFFCLFILSCFDLTFAHLFYVIVFYYYSLDACVLMRDRKGADSDGREVKRNWEQRDGKT